MPSDVPDVIRHRMARVRKNEYENQRSSSAESLMCWAIDFSYTKRLARYIGPYFSGPPRNYFRAWVLLASACLSFLRAATSHACGILGT